MTIFKPINPLKIHVLKKNISNIQKYLKLDIQLLIRKKIAPRFYSITIAFQNRTTNETRTVLNVYKTFIKKVSVTKNI